MKLKLCEIVTDADKIDINKVLGLLETKDAIRDYAFILHDKDDTRAHYHIAIRLKDSYDTKYVAEWLCIGENFINKVKGRWSDMLKYLTHENAKDKYQYSPDEVVSNFDWQTEKNKYDGNKRISEIVNMIVDGQIREFNYNQHITPDEYVRFKRQIKDAFEYRKDKIKGVSRIMNVVFITGDSGTGKTTYAKQIAEVKGYSVYVSSGSNDVLDDYQGQDCIILDDLRPSSLGLADLLKMLDNHTASTVKSRYKNKVLECKMIIITTVNDIDTFFRNVFKDDEETSVQLKRRCETHIRMTEDKLYMKAWMKKERVYGKEFEMPNPIKMMHKVEVMSEEEQLEKLINVLGVAKDMVQYTKDNYAEFMPCDEPSPFDKK